MLPRVQPIAPIRWREPFDDPGWLFDLKYDGFRALCYLEQGRCRLISRYGNLMSGFAGLSDQVAASLDVSDAILDGEVIATDETGRPRFYDLLRQSRAPTYVAFDVLWLNGIDLRPLPLTERRQHLQNILPRGSAIVSEALSVAGRGNKLFELTCAHDLEGIVAKRLKDGYGSRVRWLKIKNPSYSQNEGRRKLFDRSAGAQGHHGLSLQAATTEAEGGRDRGPAIVRKRGGADAVPLRPAENQPPAANDDRNPSSPGVRRSAIVTTISRMRARLLRAAERAELPDDSEADAAIRAWLEK